MQWADYQCFCRKNHLGRIFSAVFSGKFFVIRPRLCKNGTDTRPRLEDNSILKNFMKISRTPAKKFKKKREIIDIGIIGKLRRLFRFAPSARSLKNILFKRYLKYCCQASLLVLNVHLNFNIIGCHYSL